MTDDMDIKEYTEQSTDWKKRGIIIAAVAAGMIVLSVLCFIFFSSRSDLTATTIRIIRYIGQVSLSDIDGEIKLRADMLLHSGNVLVTADDGSLVNNDGEIEGNAIVGEGTILGDGESPNKALAEGATQGTAASTTPSGIPNALASGGAPSSESALIQTTGTPVPSTIPNALAAGSAPTQDSARAVTADGRLSVQDGTQTQPGSDGDGDKDGTDKDGKEIL